MNRFNEEPSAPSDQNLERLRCPACGSALRTEPRALTCRTCSGSYEFANGFVDFLEESHSSSSWKLRQFFEWITPFYESLYFPALYRLGTYPDTLGPERGAERLVERLGTTGGTALDVACGPGLLTRKLAGSHDGVYGLDLSRSMLKRAASRTPERLSRKTCYVRGDALDLPFAPNSLDALTCSGALYFFPSLSEVLNGFASVLRPGGRLAGMTVVTEGIFSGALSQRLVELYQSVETFRVYEIEELESALEAAGFENFNYEIHGCVVLFDATYPAV